MKGLPEKSAIYKHQKYNDFKFCLHLIPPNIEWTTNIPYEAYRVSQFKNKFNTCTDPQKGKEVERSRRNELPISLKHNMQPFRQEF